MIDPVEVSFARNWDPNRGGRSQLGRLNADDMAAIQTGVADLFRETFRAELERGGYQLVEVAGPDTLRVSAAIVDLVHHRAGHDVGRSLAHVHGQRGTHDPGRRTARFDDG